MRPCPVASAPLPTFISHLLAGYITTGRCRTRNRDQILSIVRFAATRLSGHLGPATSSFLMVSPNHKMASQHVFVIAHERSGTHLSIDALRNNFEHLAAPYLNVDRMASRHRNPADPKKVLARLRKAPRVIKSHIHSDVERNFEDRPEAIPLVQSLGRGRQRYDQAAPLRPPTRRSHQYDT